MFLLGEGSSRAWQGEQTHTWTRWASQTRNNHEIQHRSVICWRAPGILADKDRTEQWPIRLCLCLCGGNLRLPIFKIERHLLRSNLPSNPFNSEHVHVLYPCPLCCRHHTEQGEQVRDIQSQPVCRGLAQLRCWNFFFCTVMSSLKDRLTGLCGKPCSATGAIQCTRAKMLPITAPHCRVSKVP